MLRIVIAMASDDMGHALEAQLSCEHSVVRCFDGNTALTLLQHLHPDVLLTDLSLPLLDGLSLLQLAKDPLPSLVIGVTDFDNLDVRIQAKDAGFTCLYKLPLDMTGFLAQLQDMLQKVQPAGTSDDHIRRRIAQLLQQFGFKTNLTGYQQLMAGIPLVMRDMSIPMCKELYPQIAKLTGVHGSTPVEHAIRTSIRDAWENGNRMLWDQYFPAQGGRQKPWPSNKQFITTVANIINME